MDVVCRTKTEKRQEEEYFERCFQITLDAPKRIFHLYCRLIWDTSGLYLRLYPHLFIHLFIQMRSTKSNLDLKKIETFLNIFFPIFFHFHHIIWQANESWKEIIYFSTLNVMNGSKMTFLLAFIFMYFYFLNFLGVIFKITVLSWHVHEFWR